MNVPAEAQIDLGVVRDNVTGLRKHVGAAELMSVVKSDAYGHGMIPVATAELAAAAQRAGRPARVHLKVDTGMSRGGATMPDWPGVVAAALAEQAAGHL